MISRLVRALERIADSLERIDKHAERIADQLETWDYENSRGGHAVYIRGHVYTTEDRDG